MLWCVVCLFLIRNLYIYSPFHQKWSLTPIRILLVTRQLMRYGYFTVLLTGFRNNSTTAFNFDFLTISGISRKKTNQRIRDINMASVNFLRWFGLSVLWGSSLHFQDIVIQQDDEIRLKIVGTRVDKNDIVSSVHILLLQIYIFFDYIIQ